MNNEIGEWHTFTMNDLLLIVSKRLIKLMVNDAKFKQARRDNQKQKNKESGYPSDARINAFHTLLRKKTQRLLRP